MSPFNNFSNILFGDFSIYVHFVKFKD